MAMLMKEDEGKIQYYTTCMYSAPLFLLKSF